MEHAESEKKKSSYRDKAGPTSRQISIFLDQPINNSHRKGYKVMSVGNHQHGGVGIRGKCATGQNPLTRGLVNHSITWSSHIEL